jgi:hypothetical protein
LSLQASLPKAMHWPQCPLAPAAIVTASATPATATLGFCLPRPRLEGPVRPALELTNAPWAGLLESALDRQAVVTRGRRRFRVVPKANFSGWLAVAVNTVLNG